MKNRLRKFLFIRFIALLAMMVCSCVLLGQYKENPLKGKRWLTVGPALSTMDYISWQGYAAYCKRGDNLLTVIRTGYSQELIEASNDSCTDRKNRLYEMNVLWGDGWAGKKWFVTGAVGFALNVHSYCTHGDYSNRYITAMLPGVAAHIQLGWNFSKHFGICISAASNLNFRAPYTSLGAGIIIPLAAKKIPS